MERAATGQVTTNAAEVFEELFVPAFCAFWAARAADELRLAPGDRALDVACGTGALAREAARRVAPGGAVAGIDRNAGMLAVARRKAPQVELREGMAESLPWPDASFDAVGSQFGLMFFEEPDAALREMRRVLRPGGRAAVLVWDDLARSPGYAAFTDLLERRFGPAARAAMLAPFSMGDPARLRERLERAGFADARAASQPGTARFPSLEAWIRSETRGWTLESIVDDAGLAALLDEARDALGAFVRADGSVEFPMPAVVGTGVSQAPA